MGIPSASWNATGGGSPVQGSDLNRCSRPPNLEAIEPPEPVEPVEPGTVAVFIHRYDATFHRGGAGSEDGMEIVCEVASERPIREIEVFLDDGSPRFSLQFTGELDGRYFGPPVGSRSSMAHGSPSCAARMMRASGARRAARPRSW